jgi:AcrR family transcriptional regulator
MQRTKARRQRRDDYHHGDLPRALLTAGRALLEEGGPSALNLREIARRVGVSAPSAYHHFPNLEAIAVALAAQGFERMTELLETAPTNERGKLASAGEAYIAFARANPGLYRLMFGDGFHSESEANAEVRAMRQRAYKVVAESLQKRLPATQVPIAALYLWSLVHGLALLLIDGQLDSGASLTVIVQSVLRMAGTGLPTSA